MSCVVAYGFKCHITESLEVGVAGVQSSQVIHSNYDESGTLTASTTPPVTKPVTFLLTLSGGAATINLAALTAVNGATYDFTGLRLQFIRIKNLGANSMAFAEGASSGIALACGTITVPAGGIDYKFLNDAAPDVAAADRTIDVTGTGTQTAEITLVAG